MNTTNTINNSVTSLINNAISTALSYTEYRELMQNLVASNKSTGVLQTDALANYTMLNDKRMKTFRQNYKVRCYYYLQNTTSSHQNNMVGINRKLVW